MDVQFINPFVEAAYEVLKTETGHTVERGVLRLERGPYTTEDVTVLIALVGAVEGTVFYSMNRQTALLIASAMMGEQFEELEALAQSGIGELGNVITGRASMKLSQTGYEATISPPSLILGAGSAVSTLDCPRLVLPLLAGGGTVTIHLALRASAFRALSTAQMSVPAAPKLA